MQIPPSSSLCSKFLKIGWCPTGGGMPALLHLPPISCWGPPVQTREKQWVGKGRFSGAGLWQLLHPLAFGRRVMAAGVAAGGTFYHQSFPAGLKSWHPPPCGEKSFYLLGRPRKSLTMSQFLSFDGLNPKCLFWVHVSGWWHQWKDLKTLGGGTWLQEVGVIAWGHVVKLVSSHCPKFLPHNNRNRDTLLCYCYHDGLHPLKPQPK